MLFAILISLVVWALIFYIVWWGLSQMEIPEPFSKVIRVIIILAVVIVVIGLLMGSIAPFTFLSSTFSLK